MTLPIIHYAYLCKTMKLVDVLLLSLTVVFIIVGDSSSTSIMLIFAKP